MAKKGFTCTGCNRTQTTAHNIEGRRHIGCRHSGMWQETQTPEKRRRDYEATRCANVDCPDPENSLKVQGGSKVSFRVDVLITRGAPRLRVLVCAACYNKHSKAPEGYGRRVK